MVNATDYADLEVVVLGLLQAQALGRSFLYRTGPSFVRALAGLEPKAPLTAAEIWPTGSPAGHGLIVVGSHVGLTSRQVQVARSRGGLTEVELDVATLLDPASRDAHVAEVTSRVVAALADADVLLYTQPQRWSAARMRPAAWRSPGPSPRPWSKWSAAPARPGRPGWSPRAASPPTTWPSAASASAGRRSLGQLLPGLVSVFRPMQAPTEVVGVPYVVFAGNVGDDTTLAYVIDLLRGRA